MRDNGLPIFLHFLFCLRHRPLLIAFLVKTTKSTRPIIAQGWQLTPLGKTAAVIGDDTEFMIFVIVIFVILTLR